MEREIERATWTPSAGGPGELHPPAAKKKGGGTRPSRCGFLGKGAAIRRFLGLRRILCRMSFLPLSISLDAFLAAGQSCNQCGHRRIDR